MSAANFLRFLVIADRIGPDRLARLVIHQEETVTKSTLAFLTIAAALAALTTKQSAEAASQKQWADQLAADVATAKSEGFMADDDLATLTDISTQATAAAEASAAAVKSFEDLVANLPTGVTLSAAPTSPVDTSTPASEATPQPVGLTDAERAALPTLDNATTDLTATTGSPSATVTGG